MTLVTKARCMRDTLMAIRRRKVGGRTEGWREAGVRQAGAGWRAGGDERGARTDMVAGCPIRITDNRWAGDDFLQTNAATLCCTRLDL